MTPVVIFSLVVHEYSHGKVALILGDNTAQKLGRLSFNPLRHLDLLGTLFFFIVGVGWAKPVPVDWRNFENPRKDMMYVALAGPLSNIAMAVVCGVLIRMISPQDNMILFVLLSFGVFINVGLAIFNLLPIAPLDGGSVLKGLVPFKAAVALSKFDRYGAFLILGVVLLDTFAHTGILQTLLLTPINFAVYHLTQEAYPTLAQVLMTAFAR